MDATKERELETGRVEQHATAVAAVATHATVSEVAALPGEWPMSGDDLAILVAGRVRDWTPQPLPDASVDNAARPDDPTDDAAHEQPGMLDVDVSNSTVLIDTNLWTGTITVMLNDATIYEGDPENDENAVEILRQATEAYRNGDHAKLNSLLR